MRLVGHKTRRWLRDEKGVAAVEAALIAPVAVGLLGLIAIWAQAIAIQRKVTLTAHTITDLVTQQGTQTSGACTASNSSLESSVNQSTVDNLLNNAANVLYPYVKPTSGTNPVTGTNMSNMTMVVSEINVDSSGTTATVQWSEPMPSHGTALATTAHAVTLPDSVASATTNRHHGNRHLRLHAAGDRRDGRHDHPARHDLHGAPPVVVHEPERRPLGLARKRAAAVRPIARREVRRRAVEARRARAARESPPSSQKRLAL